MKTLHLGPGLEMPVDVVTTTAAILAKKRVGKTHNASVLAEEMLKADQQVAIIDPTDAWHGLRSSADGKAPGFPVIVFGGNHQDVPLEATAGTVVADFVVDSGKSVILCLDGWSKGDQARFVQAFCERLYGRNTTPIHLFIDEADAFAPQKPYPEQMRMLGAIDTLVRRGGIKGIGVTLITQRSAVLNKDVLSQIEILIVMRTLFKGDKDAVKAWTDDNGDPALAKELFSTMPTLKIGEAWVWSPALLEIFKRVQFRRRETFDSSATPKVGERKVEPKVKAAVDLEALSAAIKETVERVKQNDPKELRAEVARLRAELAKKQPAAAPAEVRVERVEVSIVPVAVLELLERLKADAQSHIKQAQEYEGALWKSIDTLTQEIRRKTTPLPPGKIHQPRPIPSPALMREMERAGAPESRAPVPVDGGAVRFKLGSGETRILAVLASAPVSGLTRLELAIRAVYDHNGGGFKNVLSALRTSGLLETTSTGKEAITPAGKAAWTAMGSPSPFPSEDLVQAWSRKVGGGARRILRVLLEAYPSALTRAEIAEKADFDPNGGGFKNCLSELRAPGLLLDRHGPATITQHLVGS